MKAHKNSRNAVAGLLAIAGSVTIGGFIINANAGPPLQYYESGLLCAFNASFHISEIVSYNGSFVRDACDHLATNRNFNRSIVDPSYATGVIRIVDPRTAEEENGNHCGQFVCSGSPVPDCVGLFFNSTGIRFENVEAGWVGCFGEGAPRHVAF